MRRQSFSLSTLLLASLTAFGQTAQNAPYLNPDLPAEHRAADIVSRMTLEEKVLQMQNSAPAIERLGVPAYDWWNEALHGVARAGNATVFPQAIGLAAMWDTPLMHRIAEVISTEARAKYNEAIRNNNHRRYYGLTFWSPNINIFRDPRWGRGQETYGEDPYLTGRTAVAFIRGLQGTDPHHYKVIATAKHYAIHSGPEPTRHEFDVHVSDRDLNETYLPAFRASMVEAKAYSIMCAYNSVDGVPACANTDLLEKRLRGDWAFPGYVVSDCGAIYDIFHGHKFKATAAEASATAVKAGTDLTCGNEYGSLVQAVKSGLITEAEINRSLERLFVARFRLGMFDPAERVPFSSIPYSQVDSAEHRRLALAAARQSIVLLKNEQQTLPLKSSVKRIAVIGPSADDPESLLGNYNGISSKQVTPLEGIQRQFKQAEVRYALGSPYVSELPVIVPSEALTPPDGNGHGLLAEYFDNREFQGEPKLRRVERHVYVPSRMDEPGVEAVFHDQAFATRWSGTLRAPVTGEYRFATKGSPVQMFLDDNLVTTPGSMQLEAGHDYKIRVEYKPANTGSGAQILWSPPADAALTEAVDAAKNADVAIIFAGLSPNLEGEEMPVKVPGFLGGDRTNIEIPEPQQKLIEAVIGTGKPVVVVLASGSAVAANYAAEHANAVLEAWYGGEEIGTAVAETLAGSNNPAGRLPVTFYKSIDQLPPFEDYAMQGRTYRYFKGDVLYPFGYGLSYSDFKYSGLRTRRTAKGGQIVVRVKNDSPRAGDEVVQLYFAGGSAPDDAVRELRGFQRIHLRAGESRPVQFSVPAEDLPKDKVQISVGGGQPIGEVPRVEGTL